eukprot:2021822-Pleurochrysis_carterae.AAC.4
MTSSTPLIRWRAARSRRKRLSNPHKADGERRSQKGIREPARKTAQFCLTTQEPKIGETNSLNAKRREHTNTSTRDCAECATSADTVCTLHSDSCPYSSAHKPRAHYQTPNRRADNTMKLALIGCNLNVQLEKFRIEVFALTWPHERLQRF